MGPPGRNSKKKKRQRAEPTPPFNSPISSYDDDPWLPIIKRRRRFTLEEANVLEAEYTNNSNPTHDTLQSLASSMNTSRKIITTWFQNRRAKNKRRAREEEHGYNSDTNSTGTTTSAAVTADTLLLPEQKEHDQEEDQAQQQQINQLLMQDLAIDHSQYYSYYPISLPQQEQQYKYTENGQELLIPHQQTWEYKDHDKPLLLQQELYSNYITNASSSNIVSTNNNYAINNDLLLTSTACTPPLYVNPAELELDYKSKEKSDPIILTYNQQ